MNKYKALTLALDALSYQIHETYEGSEYDDPDVDRYIKEQQQAYDMTKEIRDGN